MPHNEHEKASLASLQRWGIIAAPMSPWSHNDTMAALSTAPGAAGLAVIRLSGPQSLAVADRVFRCGGLQPSQRPTHTVVAGRILDGAEVIDEALLLIMRAPHSYTREDVVEIQCHGGLSTSRRVLRCVLAAGARPAEPGEFTRRAFLNGRLDLVQAEAVNDLIRARSDRSAQAAVEQLEGRLSLRFNEVYDRLIQGASAMEVALDFPDDELPPPVIPDVLRNINWVASALRDLLATWDEGHCLRDGLLVVIAGCPNVGKSTLMNALLGRERSIVSEIPGTTRDTIEESFVLHGVPLTLVDTAGLRDSSCTLEREGIRRARQQLSKADLYLYVGDASRAEQQADKENLKNMPSDQCLVVGNKIDLGRLLEVSKTFGKRCCEISVTQNIGMEELKNKLYELIEIKFNLGRDAKVVISERHRDIIMKALPQVDKAIELLREGSEESFVLVVSHLRSASELMGLLTGREYNESLLDSIFSNFCIGK